VRVAGPAVVLLDGTEVVPVGGAAVVPLTDWVEGAVGECAVGTVCRCGDGVADVGCGTWVLRGPPTPVVPVVVPAPSSVAVEVGWLVVVATVGRVVVVGFGGLVVARNAGRLALLFAGRVVVTAFATVRAVPGELASAAVILGPVVLPVVVAVVVTLAASGVARTSLV